LKGNRQQQGFAGKILEKGKDRCGTDDGGEGRGLGIGVFEFLAKFDQFLLQRGNSCRKEFAMVWQPIVAYVAL
jgi:hypothetical protein